MKTKFASSPENPQGWLVYYCPGCQQRHAIPIKVPNHLGAVWRFNGNVEAPTLTPSVNFVGSCHHFLTDGALQYCGDSTHELAGQTVALSDLPE